MQSESGAGDYSIATVAELTGVPESTLREWESTYGLIGQGCAGGGSCIYTEADVARVKWLKQKVDVEGMEADAAHGLLEREQGKIAAVAEEASSKGAIMILVAEKDPITAQLEEYFLGREGYDVHIVLDGREAIDRAAVLQPDLIILDVILPGMNGLKVCTALKADPATAAIPILVFSVLDVCERALRSGADAFLLKPIAQPKLIAAVNALLSGQKERPHGQGQ